VSVPCRTDIAGLDRRDTRVLVVESGVRGVRVELEADHGVCVVVPDADQPALDGRRLAMDLGQEVAESGAVTGLRAHREQVAEKKRSASASQTRVGQSIRSARE
jgi:hypothetical protein